MCQREVYQSYLKQETRADFEQEFNARKLASKVRDLVFDKAWELGHSYGVHEVRDHYEDLIEIANAATGAAS